MIKTPVLKGLERSEDEKKEALITNHPLLLSLYLDTVCNLDCIFCFLDSGESHRKEQLSLAQYQGIINQGKDLGIKTTLFFGAGEPLMDEKLFPLIEYSNRIGLYSVIFTNASLVTREIAKRVKDLDLSVVTSIKSRNPKTLEELTGVEGSAKRIYEGFQHLLEAGLNQTYPTRLGMDILICKQVYDEVPELIRSCLGNNIYPMVESLLWKGRAVENYNKLQINDEQKKKLLERLKEEFPEIAGERAYFDGSACDIDHYTMFVNYDGDVWQCFSRDIVAGNVRNDTLRNVWNSPSLRRLREDSSDRSCAVCIGRRYNLEKSGLINLTQI
ncbi:MAG TPA: radical SAM protein [Candidatus Nanoarchaeia archaeon]|nr:radical SAM protein [Candidatus Nanoarchaeia archaeon]